MRFEELLNALPADLNKLCHEIAVRSVRDRQILLKKLLRGAFDAGRYNKPNRQQIPAPFMPDRSTWSDQLEAQEMTKWSGLWRTRDYRAQECPAGSPVRGAIDSLGITSTDSIVDLGCGRGLALQAFTNGGFELVTGVDIASNALDEQFAAHYPLLRACLWNLPDCIQADFGYCADVMDHIPIERVDSTLSNISRVTKRGCFFKLCSSASSKGVDYWEKKINQNWPVVKNVMTQGGEGFWLIGRDSLIPDVHDL